MMRNIKRYFKNKKAEKTIKLLKDTIKGLNDFSISHSGNQEVTQVCNKATDILEGILKEQTNEKKQGY